MQIVERHIVKDSAELQSLCEKTKALYNQVIYYLRQAYFGKIQRFSEFELTNLMTEFNDPVFRSLPCNINQQTIKFAFKTFKSFFNATKEWQKNPSKFLGKPRLPKYKKELAPAYFTYVNFRLKNGYIHFVKDIISPIKTNIQDGKSIKQARVIPKSNHFIVEFVYEVKEAEKVEFNDKILGIDMGLNNLATCTSTTGESFIINGRPLKAINHFYNKRKAILQSLLPSKRYASKRIERLTFKRNQRIYDYIHKASRFIVDKAKAMNVSRIVIGKNEGWKQGINLGKKTNREFTAIPHSHLINKIEYKAQMAGIEVITTEESYTSKCSGYDLELIQKHEKYVGKRTKRGLFRTAMYRYINADANGSVNIIRKVFPDTVLRHIEGIRSCVVQPCKIKFQNYVHIVFRIHKHHY